MTLPGIHSLPIPTPFQIGVVNAYAIEGPPLTLIDPGPHSGEALDALNAHFERLGLEVDRVEQLLITHPHMDHFGLGAEVKARSGCRVLAHPDAVDKLADFAGHYANEQAYFHEFLISMGMPGQHAKVLTELPASFAVLAPPLTVDQTVREGDRLRVGPYTLEAIETPGHSPGSLCFYLPEQRALFAGDHLIDGITPNPLLEMPPAPGGSRAKSLVQYVDSLEKISRLPLEVVFSGHRNLIDDPERVIAFSFKHSQKRSAKVLGLVKQGPLTAYELMGQLFPHLPATEQFLGMSEAVGHLEWLEDQDRVRSVVGQGVVRYEAV